MNEPINLQSYVGKTYQRDGNRCQVEFPEDDGYGAGIQWSENDDGGWQCFDVPEAMLKAWLEGATEVKNGR